MLPIPARWDGRTTTRTWQDTAVGSAGGNSGAPHTEQAKASPESCSSLCTHTAKLQRCLRGPAHKGIMAGSRKILNRQIKTYKTTLGRVTPPFPSRPTAPRQ